MPHTVGYVTNLDASLSLRALTSLRAELNHRMRLMEGKAKDLAEMLERYPDEAPPSLVIVVDEFATLVKEVPDFVAGIVDIAQRGRSLGVHLILATQRPSGSVNDNILANTNLRISLRMLDGSESQTIIGVKAAADIPLPLKGRGFAKLGPRDLIEFQSAYTGAPLTEEAEVSPVVVTRFGSIARLGASATSGWRQTSGGSRIPPATSGGRLTPVLGLVTPPGVAPTVTYDPLVDEHGALAPPMSAPMQPPAPPRTLAPPTARERVSAISAFPNLDPSAPGTAEKRRNLTHLDVLLDAVRNAMPKLPAPRKPWREMLPGGARLGRRSSAPTDTAAAGAPGRYPHARHARRPGCTGAVPGGLRPRGRWWPARRRRRRIGQDDGAAHRRAGRGHGRHARRRGAVRHRLRVALAHALTRPAATWGSPPATTSSR